MPWPGAAAATIRRFSTTSPRPGIRPQRHPDLNWVGLELLHQEAGGDTAVVEFVAHRKVNGRGDKLHEVSRFVREAGAWRYVDGATTSGGPD